jgi:hypothetical protein
VSSFGKIALRPPPSVRIVAVTDALILLAVFIAGPLAARSNPGEPWTALLTGASLLVILLAFDRAEYRTLWQSIAFAAACGFCVMLGLPGVLQYLGILPAGHMGAAGTPQVVQPVLPTPWMPLIWLAAAILFCVIDRSRMGPRAPAPAFAPYTAPAAPRASSATLFRQAPVYQAPPPAPAPQYAAPPPAPQYVPPPPAPVAPPPPPPPPPAPEPVQFVPPPPAPEPPPPPPPPQPVAAPPPPAPPQAVPFPTGIGKPALIYLNLVGEGLNVLRSVQAEHVGKDYYLITEPMPPGETWQFQPGQIVRCQKKNLSSGKALVAVEEAPRAS